MKNYEKGWYHCPIHKDFHRLDTTTEGKRVMLEIYDCQLQAKRIVFLPKDLSPYNPLICYIKTIQHME